MQVLYELSRMGETEEKEALKLLGTKIEQSRKLFTYLLHFVAEVARYAERDASRKAGKHLPTAADLSVNTRIAGNTMVWSLLEDPTFMTAVKDFKFSTEGEEELVKSIYGELVKAPEYAEYAELGERSKKSEKSILDFIFNQLLLPNEDFTSHIETRFINWDDDAEMMQTIVNNYLSRPVANAFADVLDDDKRKFGNDLLKTVLSKGGHLAELIKPKLKNWDAERIATLDMILLRMGVAEFLYFDTIPPKVTINEYIDLAKEYSTAQSGQFVNGILDTIHKEMVANNTLTKVNFKKNA